MNAILQSFLLVFASEIGDKTQILALLLALRFKQPWTIMAGILVATLINHSLAAWLGGALAAQINPRTLSWILAFLFFGFSAWVLIPDAGAGTGLMRERGAFLTTVVAYFFAEMGDKTQLATMALGARFGAPILVTLGSTAGILVADGLAVAYGERLTAYIPMVWVRRGASVLFALFGLALLWKLCWPKV